MTKYTHTHTCTNMYSIYIHKWGYTHQHTKSKRMAEYKSIGWIPQKEKKVFVKVLHPPSSCFQGRGEN